MQPSLLAKSQFRPPALIAERKPNGNCTADLLDTGERAIELCECLLDVATAMFGVSGRELRSPGRSTLEISRVRQIAMYVAHVVLRLSMTEIGNGFGRDRTTVIHACHVIEDLRDDAEFDAIVMAFERVAGAALRWRGSGR